MNQRSLFITILFIAGICLVTFGQIKKAKKQMALYNYSEAMSILNRSLKKGNTDKQAVILLIAECYRKQNDVENARKFYEKAIGYGATEPTTLFNYAQALRSCGEYKQARKYFLAYCELVPGDCRAKSLADYCDTALVWRDIPPVFEIKNATSLNSKEAEFGPVIFENQVCFTSDRTLSGKSTESYGWTGNAYLRLYFSVPLSADDLYHGFQDIKMAPDLFNKAFHDGPASFTSDFSEVLFNRTLTYKDKGKKDEHKIRTHLLKIYHSERNDSKWMKAVPFFLNSDDYSVGHPAFSPDGNVLYFVSDMEGGYGGKDLYMCHREDSKWSQPINLGPVINTFGNEMFPFMANDETLYFASDGHPGFGGLDIFLTQLADSTWLFPQQMGMPINTSFDDFSFFISEDRGQGIFSSNRPGGLGSDDLYLFRRLPKSIQSPVSITTPFLSGYVKDKRNLNPIDKATVFIFEKGKAQVLVLKTDSNGYYRTEITPGELYTVKAMHTAYIADCFQVKADNLSEEVEQNAPRDLLLDVLDSDRVFVLENIYYDLDNWNIRDDAKPALDKLVVAMKENPVNIELGSHTDSRASDVYNLQLSQKRAESAVKYIISQGINPDRITAKGYGETQLVNGCKDGVSCSEEDHQQNRRTEFKVISWDNDKHEETFNPANYFHGEMIDALLLREDFFIFCK